MNIKTYEYNGTFILFGIFRLNLMMITVSTDIILADFAFLSKIQKCGKHFFMSKQSGLNRRHEEKTERTLYPRKQGYTQR